MLRHGLRVLLALALLVAGLPVAHAMPQPAEHRHDAAAAAHAGHHCDDREAATAPSHDAQPDRAPAEAPCKCLSCSMCVAGVVLPSLRLVSPEPRMLPVVYRLDAPGLTGVAPPTDPGIPILVS